MEGGGVEGLHSSWDTRIKSGVGWKGAQQEDRELRCGNEGNVEMEVGNEMRLERGVPSAGARGSPVNRGSGGRKLPLDLDVAMRLPGRHSRPSEPYPRHSTRLSARPLAAKGTGHTPFAKAKLR